MTSFYKIVTAKAPVNIAVIKYWGKANEKLKIPLNDSLSGTLDIDDMCATTSVAISDTFKTDELWLNGKQQDLSDASHAKVLLEATRRLSKLDNEILGYKAHIVSFNNFPTAAGLASSAAGYACLAYALGHIYGLTDPQELSRLARQGSGSACRSLYGGFVQWNKGCDHNSSFASQVVNSQHWKEMRVIICVASGDKKDVSSSEGMLRSTETSGLLSHRVANVVPSRIEAIRTAIINKNFNKFADLTMKDSNQFHAICLDTFPPLFYMNDSSRQIIRLCTEINSVYGYNKVAYTFDAGPNACIYVLEDFVDVMISILQRMFPCSNNESEGLEVKGKPVEEVDESKFTSLCDILVKKGLTALPNAISYLINTSIGDGPKLIDEHILDDNLKP